MNVRHNFKYACHKTQMLTDNIGAIEISRQSPQYRIIHTYMRLPRLIKFEWNNKYENYLSANVAFLALA
jgi:hypothetical protein